MRPSTTSVSASAAVGDSDGTTAGASSSDNCDGPYVRSQLHSAIARYCRGHSHLAGTGLVDVSLSLSLSLSLSVCPFFLILYNGSMRMALDMA